MARVVVTGGAGKLGRACVDELIRHGWDVVVFDRVHPPSVGAVFVPIDLTDYGQVLDAMLGVEERYDRLDAVVHLAAVPAPGRVADHLTFMNNMGCTWNVFSAARRAAVTNIVWASSETVLGLPFDTPPPYIPVDEGYPPRPESTYSLVKTLEEAMAVQLCRWNPDLKMIRRLRTLSRLRRRPGIAQVEPVGLHRCPRRRAGRPVGTRVRSHRNRDIRHCQRRHRHVPTERGPGQRVLS
jgi:nucleoside-diphosphate-sugar epimerase